MALLNHNPDPTEDEIRDVLRGNICRCTGYTKIIDAIMQAKKMINGGKTGVREHKEQTTPMSPWTWPPAAAAPRTARRQSDMAEEFYSIGKGEIRQDALLKVTGQAEYTTDIHPRGMVYGKILGSPIPTASSRA